MADATCSVDSCERPVRARGWCHAHYERWRGTGDVQADKPLPTRRTRTCSIDGCDDPVMGRGWCSKHYQRWYKRGDPHETGPTLSERFWAKVQRGQRWECWLWEANKDRAGYGMLWLGDRSKPAHRISYEMFIGPIPDGLQIDHLCRVTSCVNPGHLEPVTAAENMRRQAEARTHCKRGHEFTSDNTYVQPSGGRSCRACSALRQRGYRAADGDRSAA